MRGAGRLTSPVIKPGDYLPRAFRPSPEDFPTRMEAEYEHQTASRRSESACHSRTPGPGRAFIARSARILTGFWRRLVNHRPKSTHLLYHLDELFKSNRFHHIGIGAQSVTFDQVGLFLRGGEHDNGNRFEVFI